MEQLKPQAEQAQSKTGGFGYGGKNANHTDGHTVRRRWRRLLPAEVELFGTLEVAEVLRSSQDMMDV